jgi:hypothetical protein
VVEFDISVLDDNHSSERFTELNLCPSEAEAFWLGRDLEAASVPLHDVVVAGRAFVKEEADSASAEPPTVKLRRAGNREST